MDKWLKFTFSKPVLSDPKTTDKYPLYKTTIYISDGVRKKYGEWETKWPPENFGYSQTLLSLIRGLIEKKFRGIIEVHSLFYVCKNIVDYLSARHKTPTKIYIDFYQAYDLAHLLARDNGIQIWELQERNR